jgi:FdrA protein
VSLTGKLFTGRYVDSITLMRIAEEVRGIPGVSAATLVLATPANRQTLVDSGLWPPEIQRAGPEDLVIAISAADAAAGSAALERAEALLTNRSRGAETGGAEGPHSIVAAARAARDANLAVIAVPGRFAVAEAHQALSAGLHVFLFSDGVALADEVELKQRAASRGLLVMGPECGTSLVNGVGIGFANVVRLGAVGLVGASGTGLQEVTTLVHRLGGGVSHAIGTGGRDLDRAVGGVTTRQALGLLAADAATRAIVIVSKPADDAVGETVLAEAAGLGKPVVACLLGWRGKVPAAVRAVPTLEDAARAALDAVGIEARPFPRAPRPRARVARDRRGDGIVRARRSRATRVHGLYTGGTLCEEARAIVGDDRGRFVDFGDARYTGGRPHPMIDPELRTRAIIEAADDPDCGVVLLDVVLGHCAHPDPAGAAATAIAAARTRARRRRRDLVVVAHVVGTDDDPQGLRAQETRLRDVGAIVCPSNRLAATTARDLAHGRDAR